MLFQSLIYGLNKRHSNSWPDKEYMCLSCTKHCSKSNKSFQTKASDGLPRIIQRITGSLTGSLKPNMRDPEIFIYVLGLIYVPSPSLSRGLSLSVSTLGLNLSLSMLEQCRKLSRSTGTGRESQEGSLINYLGPYLLCANQQSFRDFTGFAFHNATENECLTAANSTQRRFPLPY